MFFFFLGCEQKRMIRHFWNIHNSMKLTFKFSTCEKISKHPFRPNLKPRYKVHYWVLSFRLLKFTVFLTFGRLKHNNERDTMGLRREAAEMGNTKTQKQIPGRRSNFLFNWKQKTFELTGHDKGLFNTGSVESGWGLGPFTFFVNLTVSAQTQDFSLYLVKWNAVGQFIVKLFAQLGILLA